MLAADRAHVPLWDFMTQPLAYREMYRVAVASERRAQVETQKRQARRERLRRLMQGGR